MPLWLAAPAPWVQEASLVRLIAPLLASDPALSNRPLALVMSNVAPESTVKVPLLVVVVAVSWSSSPLATVTCELLTSAVSSTSSSPLSTVDCTVPSLVSAPPVIVAVLPEPASRASVPLLVTVPDRVVVALPLELPSTVTVCPAAIVPDSVSAFSRSKAPVPALSASVPPESAIPHRERDESIG